MYDMHDIFWNMFVELRKEIVSSQEIRAKIIGFKITFLSAGIGLIYANIEKVKEVFIILLLIPAVAAIFFDLLIHSYSYSIKRIGFYCRHYVEKELILAQDLPKDFVFWEDFVSQKKFRQMFSFFGNQGLTLIVILLVCYNGIKTLDFNHALALITSMVFLFLIDILAAFNPWRKFEQ
jgi:hypothetical protein